MSLSLPLPASGRLLREPESGPHRAGLTPAERRVLALVCDGYSNKEIASELGRAEATIKHQVSACLRKFGQPSRARLIAGLR